MRALVAALLLLPGAAFAGDCANAQSQAEMTDCAGKEFQAADAQLNATYKQAVAAAHDFDSGLQPAQQGAETALRAAQRAWLGYRDAACASEGYLYHGGTMEPMVEAACMARLTRQRTEDLKVFLQPG